MELLVTEVSARLWLNANCARNHRGAMRNAARTVALARVQALGAVETHPRRPQSGARSDRGGRRRANASPRVIHRRRRRRGRRIRLESFTRSEEASSAEDASFGAAAARLPARSPSRSASASSSRAFGRGAPRRPPSCRRRRGAAPPAAAARARRRRRAPPRGSAARRTLAHTTTNRALQTYVRRRGERVVDGGDSTPPAPPAAHTREDERVPQRGAVGQRRELAREPVAGASEGSAPAAGPGAGASRRTRRRRPSGGARDRTEPRSGCRTAHAGGAEGRRPHWRGARSLVGLRGIATNRRARRAIWKDFEVGHATESSGDRALAASTAAPVAVRARARMRTEQGGGARRRVGVARVLWHHRASSRAADEAGSATSRPSWFSRATGRLRSRRRRGLLRGRVLLRGGVVGPSARGRGAVRRPRRRRRRRRPLRVHPVPRRRLAG